MHVRDTGSIANYSDLGGARKTVTIFDRMRGLALRGGGMLLSWNFFHFYLQSFAVNQSVCVFVTMCMVLGRGFGEQKSRLLSSGVHYLGLRMWRVSQLFTFSQLDHFHFLFLFLFCFFSIVCGDLTALVHLEFVYHVRHKPLNNKRVVK